MVVDDQKAILLPLIDEFSETRSEDPDRMRLRMRALVFYLLASFLFNKDPSFGDLHLCPMVRLMEDMGCIGGIVLAETIRSLDRAWPSMNGRSLRSFSRIHYSGLVKGPPPSGCYSYFLALQPFSVSYAKDPDHLSIY
ncbi:hypothetical protein JCGZ_20817 [Jatropha curcas]|uniref:Uncharacterized protein n=1 Tax=Jatropha curcas TaxID=180498 RepID=A0A067K6I6_JATCU|nr:hypothetical protein JCGZ_20817 [Jatropha curcas]